MPVMERMPENESEHSLILRSACHEEAAAAVFESQYRMRLERRIIANGIPAQDAPDIVQEALFAAILRIRSGERVIETSLGAWLAGIVTHKIADYWRARQKSDWTLWPPDFPPAGDHLEGARCRDLAIFIEQVLRGMPNSHRTVLLLNKSWGWTVQEMAQRMKLRPGTVGRRLAEAGEMFRQRTSIPARTADGVRGTRLHGRGAPPETKRARVVSNAPCWRSRA